MPDIPNGNLGGIDLGGTKIETALFDNGFRKISSRRRPTPQCNYQDLIATLNEEISWLRQISLNEALPLGIAIPGVVDHRTGAFASVNLPTSGQNLHRDLQDAAKCRIAMENDCKCFALSEANGGAGAHYKRVFGLIMGTGIGGGFCADGVLETGASGLPGEVGHIGVPGNLIEILELPLFNCGCGRIGCYETLISGQGLSRLGETYGGKSGVSSRELVAGAQHGNRRYQHALEVWHQLVAELIHTIKLTLDPECIVLGGGLSNINGVAASLQTALAENFLPAIPQPVVRKPVFGDASGGRGRGDSSRTEHWQVKTMSFLRNIAAENRAGKVCAIPSVCSANPSVLRAALLLAKERATPILIEATSNQVNQFGGYTGMSPADFVGMVDSIATGNGVDPELYFLGGGPFGSASMENRIARNSVAESAGNDTRLCRGRFHQDFIWIAPKAAPGRTAVREMRLPRPAQQCLPKFASVTHPISKIYATWLAPTSRHRAGAEVWNPATGLSRPVQKRHPGRYSSIKPLSPIRAFQTHGRGSLDSLFSRP